MIAFRQIRLAVLAAIALLSGCAQEPVADLLMTATYEPPQGEIALPEEAGCWQDNMSKLCPVHITAGGQLFHQGQEISTDVLPGIRRQWEKEGYPILGVAVHPQASFLDVVKHLAEIYESADGFDSGSSSDTLEPASAYDIPFLSRYALVDLERRSQDIASERSLQATIAFADREYVGQADEFAIKILVGSNVSSGQWVFKVNDISLSSPELRELAFIRLDDLVRRAGVDELFIKLQDVERVVAHIQADEDTIWPCVGAAAYQVGQAGWPNLRFEVMQKETPEQPASVLETK
jgi:hypothetical protein